MDFCLIRQITLKFDYPNRQKNIKIVHHIEQYKDILFNRLDKFITIRLSY